jgi:hypothetical protein
MACISLHGRYNKADLREIRLFFCRLKSNGKRVGNSVFSWITSHPLCGPLVRANHPIVPITYSTEPCRSLVYPS